MNKIETLRTLSGVVSVSGDEARIASVLSALAASFSDEIYTDTLGNLIVRKKGPGKKLLLSANMDTAGMIVTFIEKEGFVRFGAVGGLTPRGAADRPVRFRNGAGGIVKAEEKAERAKLALTDLYLDVGAKDEAEAKRLVKIGETAAFAEGPCQAGGRIVSPYLDNRAGCVILLEVLERLERCENDLYFVFSAQEAVGRRGAKLAAFSIGPDGALIIGAADAGGGPGAKKKTGCALSGGAAIKIMDGTILSSPELVGRLEECAKERGIPFQYEVSESGGGAGAVQTVRGGIPTAGVSLPVRYLHSPFEMADPEDWDACVELAVAFAGGKG